MMNELNPQFLALAREFDKYLVENDVIATKYLMFDGYQWKFPFTNGDVILHSGSYHNDTCVESYGMPWDRGDVTALPPERMAKYLGNYAEWDALDPDDITDEDVQSIEYSAGDLFASILALHDVIDESEDEDEDY